MKKEQILTIAVSILAIVFLTSCGAKKSADAIDNSSLVVGVAPQSLANCNQSVSTNLAFNLANVVEASTGQINPDWIKLKFSFLSTDVTQTGYYIRFFKWRVIGTTAQLDANPLEFSAFKLSNGQTASETMTTVFSSQVSQQFGFYIRLNDDAQYPYQVLKVVVYKTDGTVLTQSDVLIPQFLTSPIEYKFNSDGSARAENLQKLHPLYSTDVTGWSATQLKQNFDQHCF